MTTLYMLRGLPGSGKTTHALRMVKLGAKRASRDDLRDMIDSGAYSKEKEKIIRVVHDDIAVEYLASGFDVVLDNTNMKPEDEHFYRRFAYLWEVDFVIIEMGTPIEECIRRDALRPNPVGRAAIESMARLKPNPETQ